MFQTIPNINACLTTSCPCVSGVVVLVSVLVLVTWAVLVCAEHMVHARAEFGHEGVDHRRCNWAVKKLGVFGATTLAHDEKSLTVVWIKQIRAG